jgi:hypothetical protein
MSRDDDLQAMLDSIDGALADAEFPDAMRWSPDPAGVTDAGPVAYDGELVPQPPQSYELAHPPAVSAELSLTCASGVHRLCTGCGMCTCHDRDDDPRRLPDVLIIDDPYLPPTMPRQEGHGLLPDRMPAWVLAQRRPWGTSFLAQSGAAVQASSDFAAVEARVRSTMSVPPERIERLQQIGREMCARPVLPLREALLVSLATDPEGTTDAVGRVFDSLVEAFRPAVEQLGRLFADMGRALVDALPKLEGLQQSLVDAGIHPEKPPTDPRARALWLVQHRNTGPAVARAQRAHAPRYHEGRRR